MYRNVCKIAVWAFAIVISVFLSCCDVLAEAKYPYSLEDFCVDLRLWGEPQKDRDCADLLMNGELYIDINIGQTFSYSMENLDWNMEVTQSPATYQLYLQSLGMIKFLSNASLVTGDSRYIDLAEQFIGSWFEYEKDETRSGNNPKVWYDHGSALRAQHELRPRRDQGDPPRFRHLL